MKRCAEINSKKALLEFNVLLISLQKKFCFRTVIFELVKS
jgi:hypothetical protein